MIVFTSEDRAESTLMNLYGDLAPEDSVTMLEDHLDRLASMRHLVVDITELGVVGSPARNQLITHLRSAPAHALTQLIGHDSDAHDDRARSDADDSRSPSRTATTLPRASKAPPYWDRLGQLTQIPLPPPSRKEPWP